MVGKPKSHDELDDAVAERRATDALRRALTTPYKAQREIVGKKTEQLAAKSRTSKTPKAP
jgi:hypothetical protein